MKMKMGGEDGSKPPSNPPPKPVPGKPFPLPNPKPGNPEPGKPIPPQDPPSDPKPNKPNEAQGVKDMKDYTVGVYSKDAIIMRVPKDQIKIVGLKKDEPFKRQTLCSVNDSMVGVVTDFLEDENVYLVDMDDRKIFTYQEVDTAGKPEKLGCQLYLKDDAITTAKTNLPLGYFLGMKGDTILFKLL